MESGSPNVLHHLLLLTLPGALCWQSNCSYFNTNGVREMQLIQPSRADCLVRVSGVKPRSYISAIKHLVVRLLYVDLRSAAEASIALSQMSDQIVCVRV